MTAAEANARLGDYLSHMLEAARLARSYVQNLAKTEFLQDRRTQQAVVLNLMTIGEAAGRIVSECKEFAAARTEIPWTQMRGMRNRMVHGYFDIDLNIVWDTVQSSLPELEHLLQTASDALQLTASLPAGGSST